MNLCYILLGKVKKSLKLFILNKYCECHLKLFSTITTINQVNNIERYGEQIAIRGSNVGKGQTCCEI